MPRLLGDPLTQTSIPHTVPAKASRRWFLSSKAPSLSTPPHLTPHPVGDYSTSFTEES